MVMRWGADPMKGHQNEGVISATKHVPGAHEVPLEGEHARCVSGSAEDPQLSGHANTLNGLGMHAESPSRQRESANTSMESRSCEQDMSEQMNVDEAEVVIKTPVECCQQLGRADGNAGCGVQPTDT